MWDPWRCSFPKCHQSLLRDLNFTNGICSLWTTCCLSWILIICASTTKKEFWEIAAYVVNFWEHPQSIHLLKLTGQSSCYSQHQRLSFHNPQWVGSKDKTCVSSLSGDAWFGSFSSTNSHGWVSSSQLASFWRPTSVEGESRSRKSLKILLSLYKCIVFSVLAASGCKAEWRSASSCSIKCHWATCHAGPVLHWPSFSEMQPTGWSINAINWLDGIDCWLTGVYGCGWVLSKDPSQQFSLFISYRNYLSSPEQWLLRELCYCKGQFLWYFDPRTHPGVAHLITCQVVWNRF